MSLKSFLNSLGFVLQYAALVFLPLLSIRQFTHGYPLIWMPLLLMVGAVVFWIGHLLRGKVEG